MAGPCQPGANVNTQSLGQSNGEPDTDDDAGVVAAAHGVYRQLVARKILAGLSANAMAQLLEAERNGTLDALLTEAVRRAKIQAAAVRDLTAQIEQLFEPLASAISPRNHQLHRRVLRDVF